MHIALATCACLPDWEVDDRPLHAAFEQRACAACQPAWAEQVAAVAPLFNPPEVVRWNTRKTYLRELGAPLAPTVWLEPGSSVTVRQVLDFYQWERVLLKPMVGSAARETWRFRADGPGIERAQAHLDRLLPREGLMMQPYLSNIEEEGELSAIFLGARDEPWTFDPDELDLADGIKRLAEERFGPLLYARVDFLGRGDALRSRVQPRERSV